MDALLAVCIGPDDDMEKRRADIREAIADADRGEGVLVLTDMFGGTPSNLAISLLDPGKVEVIAGVNLPMLIKLAEARSRADLDSLARMGEDAGKRYIAIASNVLEGAGK
jgi:PTS system mannose-specific IIA component